MRYLYQFWALSILFGVWTQRVPDLFAVETVSPENNILSDGFRVDVRDFHPLTTDTGGELPGTGWLLWILGNISDILLMIIPLLAAISIIIAGYFMIFSGGVSEQVSKGKTIIKWNLIAIIVAFLSYSLVQLIASFFSEL